MNKMKRKKIIKFYVLCVIFLITSLALASNSHAKDTDPLSNHAQLLHRVWIEELAFFDLGDPYFDIYAKFTNNESYNIPVTIVHNLIYPDGTVEQHHWYQGILYAGQFIDCIIFCVYITNQYGEYTWEVTVTEDINGALLDQRSITWEREPSILYKEL